MQGRKAIKTLALVWLLVLLGWVVPTLAVEPLVLTAKDTGKTLTVSVGQRLTVDLKLIREQQVVAPEFDPFVLALIGQSLQSSYGPGGASSRVIYEFVVRQAGQTDLVIAVKTSSKADQPKALLKVKIVAGGGGQMT